MDYGPIITGLVGVGVITLGALTYFFQQRQLKLNGLLEAFKLLNNERHREARKDIYAINDPYKKNKDIAIFTSSPNRMENVEIVRADFDQMGMLVKRGSILKDGFLEAYGYNIVLCWDILKDHINRERAFRCFPDYMRNFEELAQKAVMYWWKKEGVDLIKSIRSSNLLR